MKKAIAILVVYSLVLCMCVALSENDKLYETLSKGDKGENVKQLQLALIGQGYLSGSADGVFGKMTETAVSKFQKDNGIKDNGIADEKTLQLLYEKETERLENAKLDDVNRYKGKPIKGDSEEASEIVEKPIDDCSIEELVNICCAINKALTDRNNLESFDVPVGTWTVGKNLNAGLYAVLPTKPKDYNHFTVSFSQTGKSIMMQGETKSGYIRHVFLNDGDIIEIEYNNSTLSPGTPYPHFDGEDYSKAPIIVSDYNDDELKTIYSEIMELLANQDFPSLTIDGGIWIVGQDIPVGTYDIKAYVNEEHGNYGFNVFSSASEIETLGGDISMYGYGNGDETSASNCELKAGNIIITNGCMATLKVSDENVFFGNN